MYPRSKSREIELEEFCKDTSFPFFIQYGYHSGDFFDHTHKDFTELVFVLSGNAMHEVGKESYYIETGDVFVVGEHTRHNLTNANEFIPCNIMFRESFFYPLFYQMKEMEGFHALFYLEPYMTKEYEFKSRLKLSVEEFESVQALIEKLKKEYDQKKLGWKEMVQAYFIQLVVRLSRNYELPNQKENANVLLIAKATSYMEANFKKEIRLDELAEMTYLSKRHFSRIFKETYQTTPMQYVVLLRLGYAKKQLRETHKDITHIALESGFVDQNYFSRCFFKHFHITPSAYKKTYRHT